MPADHVIRDQKALSDAIVVAQDLAKAGRLVTFGIHPRGPDTGYGYIQRGPALRADAPAFAVSRFVEKPNVETAEDYLKSGDYYWNSGMFVFQAKAYLSELQRLEPGIMARCQSAIGDGNQDADYFRLARDSFEACKSISIDYAVMERTDKAAIVPAEMGWSDIGSWAALWDNSDKDANGNVVVGDALYHETRNSYLRSEGPLVAALGVEGLVVVASSDAVLVGSMAATQNVKKIVEQLEHQGRSLHLSHRKVFYPWGSHECIDQDKNFQVGRFSINPGAKMSLPAGVKPDHWIVVSGAARLTSGNESFHLKENESYVPSGTRHELENGGSAPLVLIGIQRTSDAQENAILHREGGERSGVQ
jgi:mannose-1-phosphate guanylyltransferase/mannose-6-phosphate isomerase